MSHHAFNDIMITQAINSVVHSAELSQNDLLALYRTMVQIRRCEEQLARSHQRGLIHGACHTYVGQEAIAAGVCAHLRTDDVGLQHPPRSWPRPGQGRAAAQLIAELFGRATGCSHGRGGSMHLFAPEVGMMGTSGIVGPCILQAAGRRLQFQAARRPSSVAVAFFGDGAVNNGAFHEGLNMAEHLEAAGAVRLREQPVRHRGAVLVRRRQSQCRQPWRQLRYARRRAWTATTCWLSTRPRARRCSAPAAAAGPRCWNAGPIALGRTPRAWATSPIAPAKKSRSGRRAARSPRLHRLRS